MIPSAHGAGIAALQEGNAAALSNGGVPNGVRGWRFLVNSDVQVWDLGASTPHALGVPYTITLFDVATQGILAQVNATGSGDNVWEWTALGAPVSLSAGQQYIVSLWSAAGNYYFGATAPGSTWQPTGTIQYLDMRYANGATANTFPNTVLTNYIYGVPDIRYTLGSGSSGVPEPSTFAMLIGSAGLAFLVRRRNRS